MSFGLNRSLASVTILAVGLLVAPCLAADRLGTAGPIRSFGGKVCNIDFKAVMRGECDPPPVASPLPAEHRSQARVERARQLISVPRVEQAILELDAAIVDDPSNSAALLLRGRLKIPGDLNGAITDIERVLRIDPENSSALATRAYLLQGQNDQIALRDATRAVALGPENVDAFWIRAVILSRLDGLDEAERDLNSAIAVEPDEPRTLLSRAQIRMMLGKASEAENDATAVLALRHASEALQIRAVVRATSGNYAGALDDLNAILGKPEDPSPMVSGRPEFVDLYIQRALALVRTGKPAEAKRDLESIVRYGGARAVSRMQLYLRSHGFPDVKLDGVRSDQLDDAILACFVNDACGRGIAIRG